VEHIELLVLCDLLDIRIILYLQLVPCGIVIHILDEVLVIRIIVVCVFREANRPIFEERVPVVAKIELGICATRIRLVNGYEFARVGVGLEEGGSGGSLLKNHIIQPLFL
jgi:hypothetical protein